MHEKVAIKKKWNRSFGFTLAELLMVVVILGVLSAVALPRLMPQKEQAYVAEAVGMLAVIRQAEEGNKFDNGGYLTILSTLAGVNPAVDIQWVQIGMTNPNPNSLTRKWVYSTSATQVTATRFINGAPAGDPYNNKTIVLNYGGTYDRSAGTQHPFGPS